MPAVPLGISSQSRKKLEAFAFDQNLPAGDEDEEKENRASQGVSRNAEQKEAASAPPEHNIPHTPAVRIPIEDLIANTEDAFNCAPPAATPKDHVLWQTHPDSSGASIAAAATSQRSRKRAHSSSPVSSQQLSAHKDSLNLDILSKSLRTPNNDPTQDLWNRYTTANALNVGQKEPTLPVYAHVLPSSPQTPSTASKDAALRRTHSCGIEWPTSKAKRRRIETNELHSRTKELFAASRREILRRDLSNNTRVGLLLEKIQESLTKKMDGPESPSSSSPLPDRRSQALLSPTKAPSKAQRTSNGTREVGKSDQSAQGQNLEDQRDISSSSEFGDDGLDIEAFESVEQELAQAAAKHETTLGLENRGENRHTPKVNSQAHSDHPNHLMHQRQNVSEEFADQGYQDTSAAIEFDEFDDDDDEELMNEMLDLAAQYDSQPSASVNGQSVAQQSVSNNDQPSKRLETLNEFEDAFDDDDELWEDIANATSAKATKAMESKDQVRSG